MLTSTALIVAAVVTLLGLLILWSNPARVVNRVTFTCSLHMAAWLVSLHMTLTSPRGSLEGLFWLKCTYAVSASLPLHFLLVKESIVMGLQRARLHRNFALWAWMIASAILTFLPFTEFFIPSSSSASQPVRGWAYHWFDYGVIALYALLFRNALRTIKTVTGAQRLEIQVWLVGGCATAATILTLKALYAATHAPIYLLLQPLVALIFYSGTAFAITTSRVFDARQLVLVAVERVILVLVVAGAAYGLDWALGSLLSLSPILALIATTGLTLWFAVALNSWLDRIFRFYPQATAARQAA